MSTDRFLSVIDRISTAVGRAFAWLIIALMLLVCFDVLMRYAFNKPSNWAFEVSTMLYGALFMMCGAYTLAQNGHVRGDFLYGSMKPRTQAILDLILYFLFFLPGIAALAYAGYDFAHNSWVINEHSSITADGPPLYPFKMLIPAAGALVLLQGVAEIVRCVLCIKTGQWPARISDVEEIDIVKTQLEQSTYVDAAVRDQAIAGVSNIEEAAHQRASGAQK
jgi:TRAP-type mannitol/chloroaromatic compound transport system permease small subunit